MELSRFYRFYEFINFIYILYIFLYILFHRVSYPMYNNHIFFEVTRVIFGRFYKVGFMIS